MSGSLRETIKAKQRSGSKAVRQLWHKASSTYGPFYGLYRGKVVNNIDPLELNRLLVDVPTLPCSISSFAYPASPFGGEQMGLVTTPPMGANVWVKFENGDPSTPVWVGCFWTEGMKPAVAELPTQQAMSTGSFNAMVNDVPEAAETLVMFSPPGFDLPTTVTVTSEGVNLTVEDIVLNISVAELSLLMEPTSIVVTNSTVTVISEGEVGIVDAQTEVTSDTNVEGAVEIIGDVTNLGAVQIEGELNQTGAVQVEGDATITGAVEVSPMLDVIGAMTITGMIDIVGGAQLVGDLTIAGVTEGAGDIAGAGAVEAAGNIAMAGAVEVGGALVSTAYTPGGLNTI